MWPKWQKSFGAGPWMTFVDRPHEEDDNNTVQVSTTLVDNDVTIGALTVPLDLDLDWTKFRSSDLVPEVRPALCSLVF
jgi:hypothetical protein